MCSNILGQCGGLNKNAPPPMGSDISAGSSHRLALLEKD